jgi:hypothetical protein
MLPKRLVYKVRIGQWTVPKVVFLYSLSKSFLESKAGLHGSYTYNFVDITNCDRLSIFKSQVWSSVRYFKNCCGNSLTTPLL